MIKKYQIGSFSKICGLSEKTIRYYHECDILLPTYTDPDSGYRFYDETAILRAEVITKLRDLEFSIQEIKKILVEGTDDFHIKKYIDKKLTETNDKIYKLKITRNRLVVYLKHEDKLQKINTKIVEKNIDDILVATIRFKGKFLDTGKYLSELLDCCGKYCIGENIIRCYGRDKNGNYDIEMLVPVSEKINKGNVKSKILKGGKAFCLQYKGRYEDIGKAYKLLIDYFQKNHLTLVGPPREVAIRGGWTILPRNPQKFISEIQFFVK